MSVAADTNYLVALLIPGDRHADVAARALNEAANEGAIVICEAVYAELAAFFGEQDALERFCSELRVRLVPSEADVLYRAGRAWGAYTRRRPAGFVCADCGNVQSIRCERCRGAIRGRQHVLADFLIGAHALVYTGQLLTLDPRYYRTYFPELRLR